MDQQEKDDLVVEVEEDDELITEDKALMDLFWMVVGKFIHYWFIHLSIHSSIHSFLYFSTGVSMLTLALFMSAVLGIYQVYQHHYLHYMYMYIHYRR